MNECQPDRFISVTEAMALLGVKRTAFYRRVKTIPGYPRPFFEPDGRAKMSLNEIIAYQEQCKATRN